MSVIFLFADACYLFIIVAKKQNTRKQAFGDDNLSMFFLMLIIFLL
jgi:hypothetical protein